MALGAFGIDSLIEIFASTMAVWQLKGHDTPTEPLPALGVIAAAVAGLGDLHRRQSMIVLTTRGTRSRARFWLAVTGW